MKTHRASVAAVLLVGSLYAFASQPDPRGTGELTSWEAMITSKTETVRRQAESSALSERRDRIGFLLSVLAAPVEEGEPFYGLSRSRNVAINLLGKMRAKEAVDELTGWLVPQEGQGQAISHLMVFSPAGFALAEIGLPSVPPLLKIIREEGCSSPDHRELVREGTRWRYQPERLERESPLGDQCLKIIVAIKGMDETEFALQKALEAETNATRRENLQSAINWLRSDTFPAEALTRMQARQ